MINPNDLDELFGEQAKKWIADPTPAPKEDLNELVKLVAIEIPATEHVEIISHLGTDAQFRMYIFDKKQKQPLDFRTMELQRSEDDWTPSFKTDRREFRSIRPKHWYESIKLAPGTVIKVFAGITVGTAWGASYFEAAPQHDVRVIVHPKTNHLNVTGRLKLITPDKYGDYGLKYMKPSDYEPLIQPRVT